MKRMRIFASVRMGGLITKSTFNGWKIILNLILALAIWPRSDCWSSMVMAVMYATNSLNSAGKRRSILQPLDVGIFLPLSEAYKKRLYDYCTYGVVNIGKQDFLRLFEHAWGSDDYSYHSTRVGKSCNLMILILFSIPSNGRLHQLNLVRLLWNQQRSTGSAKSPRTW